jgi:AraC-like DNA-binding protein
MSSFASPMAPLRVVHNSLGPRRLVPALAWLELDTAGHWVDLDLFPLDCVAVCVAPQGGIELQHEVHGTGRLFALSPLRHAPITVKAKGRGPLAVALLTPLGAIQAFGAALGDGPAREAAPFRLPSATSLHRQLLRHTTPTAQLGALQAWLMSCMHHENARTPGITVAGLRTAEAAMRLAEHGSGPLPTLGSLAAHAGITPRQLRRDFGHWLGVSPGDYRRLVRLQRSLAHIATGHALADVAGAQGYADQAHMSREIRDWTGMGPQRLSGLRHAPEWTALLHALDLRVAVGRWVSQAA